MTSSSAPSPALTFLSERLIPAVWIGVCVVGVFAVFSAPALLVIWRHS